MWCCLPETIQPPLTIKHKSTGESLRVDRATVQRVREYNQDLEQEDRLYLGQSRKRDSAPQRTKRAPALTERKHSNRIIEEPDGKSSAVGFRGSMRRFTHPILLLPNRHRDIIVGGSAHLPRHKEADMEIATREFKRCTVIEVSGRIDSATAPQLAAVLNELIQQRQYNLVLDLDDTDFISSAGLRVLIDTQKMCRQLNRGELVLASVPEPICEAFDLAGFVPLFKFYDETMEAVGSF